MANPETNVNTGPRVALAETIVIYRKALKKSFVDQETGEFRSAAFLRRDPDENGNPRDTKGLSVNYNRAVDQLLSMPPSCHGIVELTVGLVRTVETSPPLDVEPDGSDHHANITGLPKREQGMSQADIARAESLATILQLRSKVAWRKPPK